MLLDEPLSNLDPKLRESMRFEIKELQKKFNFTIIFVTHVDEVLPKALMTEGLPVFKDRLEGDAMHLRLREGFMSDAATPPPTAH